MSQNLELGTSIVDALPVILEKKIKQIAALHFIVHPANYNWRQENSTPVLQHQNLESGLIQFKRPQVEISATDFLLSPQVIITELQNVFKGSLISILSKLKTHNLKTRHIPTMNFHPEGVEERSAEGLERIREFYNLIAPFSVGLFQTDRYWHAYGINTLLKPNKFMKWIALHLNAASLISPRYAGQSIKDGCTPTRITRSKSGGIKNVVPHLVEIIDGQAQNQKCWEHQQPNQKLVEPDPSGIQVANVNCKITIIP